MKNDTDRKIKEIKSEIMNSLNNTEELSIKITTELEHQTEIIDKIDSTGVQLVANITIIHKIINNISSIFSVFRKSHNNIPNIITPEFTILKQAEISKQNIITDKKINDDFYDQLSDSLKRIKKHTLIQSNILDDHIEKINDIHIKTTNTTNNIICAIKEINSLKTC